MAQSPFTCNHPISKSRVNQHVLNHLSQLYQNQKLNYSLLQVTPNFVINHKFNGAKMAIPSVKLLFFLFPIILLHFPLTTKSQHPEFAGPVEFNHACIYTANYTPKSTFRSNLRTALSSLRYNTATNYGFYTTSTGQNPKTKVNALALCRGDVSQQTCRVCVNDATVTILQYCPNQMQAVRWYDNCMVRYSNATVFDRVRDPYFEWNNPTNAPSPRKFNDALRDLMDRLRGEAAGGSNLRKFATGNVIGPEIYGLMQCTPDLSKADCGKCLEDATAQIPVCCYGKIGGQVIGPSCLLRFEISRFYDEIPGNPLPQPPTPPGSPTPLTAPPPSPDFAGPVEFNHACINTANYTPKSTFRTNLRTALSSLRSNTATNYGFYTTSIGQNTKNKVNALALCRGDVSQQTCRVCVNDATVSIIQYCPDQMQAVRWYDNCMVRYSNATVFDRVRDPYFEWNNPTNAPSPRKFNEALRDLMDRLRGEAAGGSNLRKFATGNVIEPEIYGLMQCTPDLSKADCGKCLEDATAQIPVCCYGKIGGQVIGPSCLLRFEVSRFYNEIPGNPLPQPPMHCDHQLR